MDLDGRFILCAALLGFLAELGLGASTEALHSLWEQLAVPASVEAAR